MFVLAVTAGIFVVVFGLLVYAVVRFRRRRDDDGPEPPQVYGSYEVELRDDRSRTDVVALFLATARVTRSIQHPPKPKDALDVVVIAPVLVGVPISGAASSANELQCGRVSDLAHPTPTFLTRCPPIPTTASGTAARREDGLTPTTRIRCGSTRARRASLRPVRPAGTQHAKMPLRVYVDSREDFTAGSKRSADWRADAAVARGRQVFETTAA
jgi:cytochrome c oxidase subunit 2